MLSSLLRLAGPIAFAQAGLALMSLVDVAVVGRLGAVPLAAVGLSNAIFMACSIFGMGLLFGLDPLVSQALGAGRRERARELYWQGLWLAVALGLVLIPPMVLCAALLEKGGIEPAVATEVRRYLAWRIPCVVPHFAFVVARGYLQAHKRTLSLVAATALANAANLLLDLWFVFGGGPVPAMGTAGAAVATLCCTFLQMGIGFWGVALLREEGPVRRSWSWPDVRAISRIGVPAGAHYFAEVAVFALAGFLAGRMGSLNLAAHQIAISLASFTFTVALGLGGAGGVLVGWEIGAGDTPGARRAGFTAFGTVTAFMGVNALLFAVLGEPIVRLLTNDPAVIQIAAPLMLVAGAFQLSDGIQAVGGGVLRGAGDTRFTFYANVVGHWLIGLPVALYLGPWGRFGVHGIWWGLSVGLTAVAVAVFARFWRLSSRAIAPLEQEMPATEA